MTNWNEMIEVFLFGIANTYLITFSYNKHDFISVLKYMGWFFRSPFSKTIKISSRIFFFLIFLHIYDQASLIGTKTHM